jgi:hypothetical protein
MAGLTDIRVYKEVVATKHATKENPICFVVAMEVYDRVEDDHRDAGVVLQS